MLKTALPRTALALIALLTACARPFPAPSQPQPLPSPAADWSMSMTQSGGFAGVHLTVEVTSDGRPKAEDQRSGRTVTQAVPPATLARLGQLYSGLSLVTPNAPRSGCADCFNYDLRANSGGRVVQVQADDTTLTDSGAAELISLLQQLRDAALRTQP